jgi:Tfp pilus assembly protein PilX
MAQTTHPTSKRTAERGAALVVGLVLLLVLTVLGVSGMNSATLELVMASNTQSQQLAFQAAETGIDLAIGNGTYLTSAPANFVSGPSRAQMACVTTTPVPDIAFSIGAPSGSAQAYHFDILAVGTGPRNSTSTHNQSFYIVGPGTSVGC